MKCGKVFSTAAPASRWVRRDITTMKMRSTTTKENYLQHRESWLEKSEFQRGFLQDDSLGEE